ncbi:TIGR03885 family FMN-dependent LLM class oxidoreductase [Georgenia faecalis]|uniref:TIGR03885 family FMN-dependent LLM class oxidoreductase n=1 Tax=Georgenia faecalis TaxID=2483799 RepID=A0ABV9D7N5_9MICO|nr:TIGR03885 family FMN-dependent LLM class oxidoreductase [Georgenia faecalis]
MTVIGFHASHEQIHPRQLLADVQLAEEVGFGAAMCSDHLEPWSERQGQSGFAWSWLGAALATTGLRFGVVNAPGQRYHPVVVAQAAATLAAMFPDRFWVALGSGENANEHVTGDAWPRKAVRQQRLEECVEVIRRLLDGDQVSHDGLVTVDRAQLWTRPETPPPLIAPALSVETARRSAAWADGLITINAAPDHLRDVLAAYREAGGRGPAILQAHLSWAPSEEEALAIAHDQWRTNTFPSPVMADLATPAHFDAVAEAVRPEDVRESVLVSADPARHTAWLHELVGLGFDEVYLHHVGVTQRPFLETFGEHVLPVLAGS